MNYPSLAETEHPEVENTRQHLERLLHASLASPDRHDEIARRIDRIFGQERAVMVLDMSGFTRSTQHQGIVASLAMIHQLRLASQPCILRSGGLLVKAEADNLFGLFHHVDDAVRASMDILRSLKALNEDGRCPHALHASIGIGFGRILNVGNEDIYGSEVNLASKLGEDIGERNEILLTHSARSALTAAEVFSHGVREETVTISNVLLPYFVLNIA